MPVPVAGTRGLIVCIVGAEQRCSSGSGSAILAADLQVGRKASRIGNAARIAVGPPVARVAKMKRVGQVRCNGCGEAGSINPGDLWLLADGSILARLISGEETADIPLISNGVGEVIIVISSSEVPVLGEFVVNTGDEEITLLRGGDRTDITAEVQTAVALTAIVRRRQVSLPKGNHGIDRTPGDTVCCGAEVARIAVPGTASCRLDGLSRRGYVAARGDC